MIVRRGMGDCNPVDVLQLPDGSSVCVGANAPDATVAASLPTFCDPDWTTINGGVCTDGMGQYRTKTGAVVTADQIHQAMTVPVSGQVQAGGFPIDKTTLAFILGGVFFFALILPRGRR